MDTGSITDVSTILVGHAQDDIALTGCTVILLEKPTICGVDVRGGAPGTRETDTLKPTNLIDRVHAICLSGGSAYGLDAVTGVMQYLEEQDIGLDVGVAVIPIVPAAVLFDLAIGDSKKRPDAKMGYLAASQAKKNQKQQGNVGAGTGATVGKLNGFENAMKSGLGMSSRCLENGLVVAAIVAVNAVGEVRDPNTGKPLAGPRNARNHLCDSLKLLEEKGFPPKSAGTNTTIAVVASNAKLTKTQATKIAQMAHDGLARTIYPVHMMYDGDTVFALATEDIEASVDLVGALSAEVLAEAVIQAILHAKGAGGLPAYEDLLT